MTLQEYKQETDDLELAYQQANVILHKDYLAVLDDEAQTVIHTFPKGLVEKKLSKYSRFYKIEKLAYSKEEDYVEKLSTVFNAGYYYGGTLAVLIQCKDGNVSYYLGTITKEAILQEKGTDKKKKAATNGEVVEKALTGNFPGSRLQMLRNPDVEELFATMFDSSEPYTISSISGIATDKMDNLHENAKFIQGMEKLIDATKSENYNLLILADPLQKEQISVIRAGYENLYSQLSPFEKIEVSHGSSSGWSATEGKSTSSSDTDTESHSTTKTESKTKPGLIGTIGRSLSAITGVGTALGGAAIFGSAGSAGIAGAITGAVTTAVSAANPVTLAIGATAVIAAGSVMSGYSESTSNAEVDGYSKAHMEQTGTNESTSLNVGKTTNTQITTQNRSVKTLLEKIDLQLERLTQCENFGTFNCAAYVISDNDTTNHIVSSMYNALMRGEESGSETSQVNIWSKEADVKQLTEFLSKGFHPEFGLRNAFQSDVIFTPASIVSGRELALHMGLPKKSVPGLPVIETAEFGRNIYTQGRTSENKIDLGSIYHMGQAEDTPVQLDVQSMASHTFITGSTGTGKSNTVYQLIGELEHHDVNFLIIEPAKGEYKHMFGMREDVHVFGTNPYYTPLIKINPFKFPEGIHVLEHVDRLVEIFNVCWPMYAAMPAVLKDSVLRAYESCGWNLVASVNPEGMLYPNFEDVLRELDTVINTSAYSADTKGDYIGSLATRLNSLTNGLYGQMFVADEIDNTTLFDSKTIVDLSRIGSMEVKSLLMGILVMRLSEHRMAEEAGMNQPLKHVTVLEEAHNILKRTSTEQSMEGANMTGKSVEMISNAIAEMRTYGEGFIIADQSPNAVDISAIRNTNTKIIMRLPDEDDRQLAGRAAALKDEQIPEIAKLPKGVAVVYQNDWLEPVLCQIDKYSGEEQRYQYQPGDIAAESEQDKWFKRELLKLLIKGRVNEPIDVDIDRLQEQLFTTNSSTKTKITIQKLLKEYKETNKLTLWDDQFFETLATCVTDILGCKTEIEKLLNEDLEYKKFILQMETIIREQWSDISDRVCQTIEQCLMKKLVTEKKATVEMYGAWIELMEKEVR